MTNRTKGMIGAARRGEGASLLLGFVLLVGGCAPPAGDSRTAAAPPSSRPAGADTLRPEFPDAAPGERQLPEPIRRELRRALESWTLAWQPALPSLRLDQFARGERQSFAAEEWSAFDGGFEGADLRLLHLVVPSPDVLVVLDPFLDIELSREGDLVRAAPGEEAGAVLVDLRGRRERRVLVLPAGSRVDGAHWLDEHRVVALVDEPARGGRRPALYLLDLREEAATCYAGPVAGGEGSRAARAELDRRFRAARREIVFG